MRICVGGSAASPSKSELSSGKIAVLTLAKMVFSRETGLPSGHIVGTEYDGSALAGDGSLVDRSSPGLQILASVTFGPGQLRHAEHAVRLVASTASNAPTA